MWLRGSLTTNEVTGINPLAGSVIEVLVDVIGELRLRNEEFFAWRHASYFPNHNEIPTTLDLVSGVPTSRLPYDGCT